jgi:pyruvate dehydrogenase E2 component (dihydrolipoamide acetyltransferase)
MAEFRMPSLGADMEAGTLVEWKVKPGDAVRRGDLVAVVDTNKGAIDLEIWEDGVVEELRVAVGAKVPVDAVLAVVRGAGARAAAGTAPAAAAAAPAPAPVAAPVPPAGAALPPLAPGPAPPAPRGRVRASPAARARARELGVDAAALRGTGPDGAVTVADVEAAAPRPAPAAAPIRQAIAAAMSRSNREIPHYYLGQELDLSRAVAWLARENERRPVTERLLLVAPLLKAVARAAVEVPEVNGHFVDGAFRPAAAVHAGVAISLRRGGLVAPALHDVEKKPLGELMRELDDLVARARRGGLRSSELVDATLTVTSLGELGVAAVYGVIYPPQVALVGFGRVAERPWASGGKVEVRPVVTATLAGDHRASDGIRGAQFLLALDRLLQAPEDL